MPAETSNLSALRATCALVLYASVLEIIPDAVLVESFVDDTAFSCDFSCRIPQNDHLLLLIEDKMKSILKRDTSIKTFEMLQTNVSAWIKAKSLPLYFFPSESEENTLITIAQLDTCFLPAERRYLSYMPATSAIKLYDIKSITLDIAGKTKQILRIEGCAFFDKSQLKGFLKKKQEYDKKSHHLFLKQNTDWLATADDSSGIWYWLQEGLLHRKKLIDWCQEQYNSQQFKQFESSTHLPIDWIKNSKRYVSTSDTIDSCHNTDYLLLPPATLCCRALLSCITKSSSTSHRWMQWKQENSRQIYSDRFGLFQTRTYMQDTAHRFCMLPQLQQEIEHSLQLIKSVIETFQVPYCVILKSKKGAVNTPGQKWKQAVTLCQRQLQAHNIEYELDSQQALFYGPLIQFYWIDFLGRKWPGAQIEIDLYSCSVQTNSVHCDVFVHSTLLGPVERFFALLIEQYGKNWPIN